MSWTGCGVGSAHRDAAPRAAVVQRHILRQHQPVALGLQQRAGVAHHRLPVGDALRDESPARLADVDAGG